MYRQTEQQMIMPDDLFLPFGGKLNKDNRWVKLTAIIPWWKKVEQLYAKKWIKGRPAVPARMALGA